MHMQLREEKTFVESLRAILHASDMLLQIQLKKLMKTGKLYAQKFVIR